MRNALGFAFVLLAIVTIANFPHPARAAEVGAVLGACDRTPGCNYTAADNGDISGCSTTSGACFFCPADGSRQCVGITNDKARPAPHRVTIGGVVIGGATIDPGTTPPPKRVTGLGTLSPSGLKQSGATPGARHRTGPILEYDLLHSKLGRSGNN